MAIGFLIALAILILCDFVVSAVALHRRPASIEPVRRFVATPGQSVRFVGTAAPGGLDMRVLVRRAGRAQADSDFAALDPGMSDIDLELAGAGQARKTMFVRHRSECSAFGLMWARRYVAQQIVPLHIAPGPNVDPDLEVVASEEITRLREYIPGDRISRISWPTTARTGQLHVRSEEVVDHEVAVVVDLGPDYRAREGDDPNGRLIGEVALELASSVVTALLAQGRVVTLTTASMREAYYEQELAEALASPTLVPRPGVRIVPGADATLAGVPATEVVSSLIGDELELIRRLSTTEHSATMSYPPAPYLLVTPDGSHWVTS